MTKRQRLNLGIGVAFLAVSIILLVLLRSREGGVVVQDGQQYIYSVDPNVYMVLLLIAFIGVTIILLTVVESRQQSGSGDVEGNDSEMFRRTTHETVQEPNAPQNKVRTLEWEKKDEQQRKRESSGQQNDPELAVIGTRPESRECAGTMTMKGQLPMNREEPVQKYAEPVKDAGRVPAMTDETGPAQRALPKPIPWSERTKGAKFVPLEVEAIGRCPMCGKVILRDQSECIKCGWKVVLNKIGPLPDDSDPYI
jgi:hypothetical protein